MRIKVKNLNGTGDNKCRCSSWLEHYKKFSGNNISNCCVVGCNGKAELGGHVKLADDTDKTWFIIPICYSCNNKKSTEEFNVNIDDLVLANVSKTCEIYKFCPKCNKKIKRIDIKCPHCK